MNMWESDFDPLAVLMQCQNNIQQCAVAINTGSELMKEMSQAFRHQQEVIEQLQFSNRKLVARLSQLDTEITLIKCEKN